MVSKPKAKKIAKRLLEGVTIKDAMMEQGYTEVTAKQGRRNPIIQEAELQIDTEMSKQGLTPERVISEIDYGLTQSKTLRSKKECLQIHSNYTAIAAKHTLSTKSQVEETHKLTQEQVDTITQRLKSRGINPLELFKEN